MSDKILKGICILSFLFTSCEEDVEFKFNTPKKIKINQPLFISVEKNSGKEIDSLIFYLDGSKIGSKNNISIDLKNKTLGKHTLSTTIYYESKSKKLHNSVYFLAEKSPEIYTYKIINTLPHDSNAFTQGFEFYKGFLYESTGQKGKSSIRKTDLKTGEILQIKNIDKKYFGEGITIFNNNIFHLTWKSKIGFVYDLQTFKQKKTFSYNKSVEGWGLTHNDKELLKSDGTERIWFLDPVTLKETHFIEAYTNRRKVENLNEIEYVKGKIYSNIWQKSTIIVINPKNGTVERVVDLKNLNNEIQKTNTSSESYDLNGIAYDSENNRLFVTGKNWDKIFEIKLLKK